MALPTLNCRAQIALIIKWQNINIWCFDPVSSFEWSINGNTNFLTDGSFGAIAYPISFNGSVTGIEQTISIVPPASAEPFLLQCEAIQFEFDLRKAVIKLFLLC